jgi:hypothetical protein
LLLVKGFFFYFLFFLLSPGRERDSRLSFTEQAADVASRLRRGEAELLGSRDSERGEFKFLWKNQ